MRSYLGLLIVACALLPRAQSAFATPPTRDAAALVAVQQAIAAMGGQSAVDLVLHARAVGSLDPAPGSDFQGGSFDWKFKISGNTYEFRSEFQSGGNTRVFVSGHGSPGQFSGNDVRPLFQHVSQAVKPYHLPAVVLNGDVGDPSESITLQTPTNVNGHPAIHVRVSNDTDGVESSVSPQDWFFAADSGLPLRVQYRIPDTINALKCETKTADYSDYRQVGGLLIPFQITTTRDAVPLTITTVTSIEINGNSNDSDYDLPAGGTQ